MLPKFSPKHAGFKMIFQGERTPWCGTEGPAVPAAPVLADRVGRPLTRAAGTPRGREMANATDCLRSS